jgi:hypothetical protein
VTRLAQVVFGVLLCAVVGAFVVAQRLKSQTPPVRALSQTSDRLFSPNGDGRRDTARISFRLKLKSDNVTVDVIDDNGDLVRRLVNDKFMREGVAQTVLWNGREDNGKLAPDGTYRPRIRLKDQGRTIVLPIDIRLDKTPPRPVVTVLGFGERSGPAVVPPGGTTPITFRFSGPVIGTPKFQVYRTDGVKPRVVASFPGRPGSRLGRWEGRVAGKPAAPGTYLVVARVADAAGNVGAVPQTIRSAKVLRGPLPGRAGVTVRSVAAQTTLEPVVAGDLVRVKVDAGGRPFSWSIRRAGRSRAIDRGSGRGELLRVRAPFGKSGVYLVRVQTADGATTIPLVVQAQTRQKVLVVLPAITWQGRNTLDDSGDGVPDTLDRTGTSSENRPFAGEGLPPGFRQNELPLLSFLDRMGVSYDLTTDLALVHGNGPPLLGRPGVLLAGPSLWLTPTLESSLRGYVQRGGVLVSMGTGALRRNVTEGRGVLRNPSPPSADDAFGSRLAPIQSRAKLRLLAFPDDPIGLWTGSDGLVRGFDRYELTTGVSSGAKLVSGGGVREDRPVIAGLRVGRGIVIRTGLPDWAVALGDNTSAAQLQRRMWRILATGGKEAKR